MTENDYLEISVANLERAVAGMRAEQGVRELKQLLLDNNIDPNSIYVVNMTESFEENDTVEVAQRFQVVKIENIGGTN